MVPSNDFQHQGIHQYYLPISCGIIGAYEGTVPNLLTENLGVSSEALFKKWVFILMPFNSWEITVAKLVIENRIIVVLLGICS